VEISTLPALSISRGVGPEHTSHPFSDLRFLVGLGLVEQL
jgi:hypothetical protein